MTSSSSISTDTDRFDFGAVPLVDHHAHAVRRDQAITDALAFRRFFGESSDPRMGEYLGATVFYRRAIRDLAALLGCAATEEGVLEARARTPFAGYARRCFEGANTAMLLLDGGFDAAKSISADEMAALSGIRVAPILRIETYAEELIGETNGLEELEEALRGGIRGAQSEGIVALKSIAAYRGGLTVEPRTQAEARAALQEIRAALQRSGRIRLE
ncbi:MAG: hypothetical protein M3380_08775, partial [Chloroflexota bacterium]|nr:hypothetical protein [Chloroflexota bacterium]